MRSLPLRLVAAVLAVGFALSGCTNSEFSTGGKGFVSGDGSVTVLDAADRPEPTGTVAGTTIDGEDVALSDYRGSLVVMPVWGSWCGPCRAEAPMLADAARELRKDGVRFLGINTRDQDTSEVKAFIRTTGIGYPSLFDPAGDLMLDFRGTLPPQTIPSFVFIDEEGRIAARVLDEITRTTLFNVVDEIRKRS